MSPSHRGTILVVDDDPGVTGTFARMLALAGYDAHTARDAQTALRFVDARRPQMILLDLHLTGVDGVGFLRELRARADQRETPVAIITGDYFVDDATSGEVHELGATLHFKPLWLDELIGIARQPFESLKFRTTTNRRLKLLIVDDSIAQRELYEMAFETEFSVFTANCGSEGVTIATRRHPDVIVLDVAMPGMDGWEACRRIKNHPDTKNIPIILLTGSNDDDLAQHAKAVGASTLLRKPCVADELRLQVLAVVSRP